MIGTNDYPWKTASPDDYDQWGYAFRNCTSFVAWRIYNDLKLAVPLWGNGGEFGAKAAAQGVQVDNHPATDCLACFLPNQNGAGPEGHVAFVMSVTAVQDRLAVNLEEYNFDNPLAYGQRLDVDAAGLQFIHYAKAVPKPDPPEEDVADPNAIVTVAIRTPPTVDPLGPGAVYLVQHRVWGPKRHFTPNGDLSAYLQLCSQTAPLEINAFVLDRMELGPEIDTSVTSPTEP